MVKEFALELLELVSSHQFSRRRRSTELEAADPWSAAWQGAPWAGGWHLLTGSVVFLAPSLEE